MASSANVISVDNLLKEHYPTLGEEVFQYVCGVLESPDDFAVPEDVYEAVGDVLLDSAVESSEEDIIRFCNLLHSAMRGGSGGDVELDGDGEQGDENKLLEAPVLLSTKLKIREDDSPASTIWTSLGADSRKGTDQKKLEKADAKLRQKQERKALKEKEQQATNVVCAGPTTNQAASKQLETSTGQARDIKVENFDIAFGNNVLLSSAELSLVFSRRYGLVGRNGVGKSTLLRALAGRELRLPSHVTILHVEQEVVGDDTTAVDSVLESDEERTRLVRLEKELTGGGKQGSSSDVEAASSVQLSQVYQRLEEIEADKAPARAAGILAGLGFSPKMQRKATREFSGGWRMRIALARALFAKPDLLLLDEPTNMLDLKAILWLENYLQNWPTTLLVVSHDRYFLTSVATDIVHMRSQRLECYKGDYEVFVRTKTEKLKNQQKEYEAQLQYRQHLQAYVDRWRYNAKRAPQAQMRIKILEKLPELTPVAVEADVKFRFPEVEKLSPPILQLSEISFSYVQGTDIFRKTNISADMESRIALVGENGTGKTTLVKLLTGDLSPSEGYKTAHRNLKIAYFTQHHVDQLDLNVSALELIQSRYPGKKEEEYRHQLGSFHISGDLALRPIVSLSGGQKSRLAFALLAMSRPNFLILDEPTNHLDVETVEALGRALKAFKGGVVLVSHDQHLIQLCTTEMWLCKDNTVHRLEGGLQQYKSEIENEFRIEK